MPLGPGHGLEPGCGLDTPDPFEIVSQGLFLDGALPLDADVLQRAPAATAVGLALRIDAVRRRLVNLEELGVVEVAV